jgi:SAM-dependent methyltransferase
MLIMHPETVQFYNAHAEMLTARYEKADMADFHRVLRRWLPPCGRILEIGCGCGREAVFMASLDCEVVATDASDRMLQQANSIINAHALPATVTLVEAAFPVTPDHPLLKQRFDAIVSVAVLTHIPDHELFEFAYQIRGMLKNKAVFICSFCAGREAASNDPRLFVGREPAEVHLLFERLGFRLLATETTADGMGRENVWTTLIFSSEGGLGARPLDQIESIINRDKKTATYKLALLRSLCEIAQTSFHHARYVPGERVSVPLGLVVEKWLYYYWPLVDTPLNLPEMRVGERAKGIAFRSLLLKLVNSCKPGGLDAFFALFQNGRLTNEQADLLTQAINMIANTVIKGPVTYSGGSLEDIRRVFTHEGAMRMRNCRTPMDLIHGLGRISFPAGLWHEMCLIGHWIGEAIIMRWAELSHEFAKREVSIPDVLALLIIRPEAERNVLQAKDIYLNHSELACVWSGKPLTSLYFDVDHVIPFALWHNNDLWNLMPAHPKINNQKRDKIVDRETLRASRDRIVHYWRMACQESPCRFGAEVGRTLLGGYFPHDNWEIPAFSALSEAVETVALQRGVERWNVVLK